MDGIELRGLFTDSQYRSTCTELSKCGYRTNEPDGMKKRETSQILPKVFQALWANGIRSAVVAAELGLTIEGDEQDALRFDGDYG
ncbi:hypothetical protein ACFY2N_25270 [Streptomyces rubiginosohelvolus]|uniref:hypothetical protein n=1 Tax=Streptomyces rubiginosohelvolus TaxID=67362 RepID=UPI0036A4AF8B